MRKFRYVYLAVAGFAVVTLGSWVGNTPPANNSSLSQTTQTATNTSHFSYQLSVISYQLPHR